VLAGTSRAAASAAVTAAFRGRDREGTATRMGFSGCRCGCGVGCTLGPSLGCRWVTTEEGHSRSTG
jgi:hypothetical protein